jgi:NADH-quinone oxidoreductase subunit M
MNIPILSVVTYLPLLGIAVIAFFNTGDHQRIKTVALVCLTFQFLVSLPLFFLFDSTQSGMQFTEQIAWLPAYGIHYHVGLDGLSLLLFLLTTFLGPIVALSTWSAIDRKVKSFTINLLLLQTGMLGAFISLNLFLFYIFWEAMLIPMVFMIGVWGGERRVYAAVKFFIFTMIGSLSMLVAFLYVYFAHYGLHQVFTFDIFELYAVRLSGKAQLLCFGAFALAFAIKVPMFPLHTWLPDAHVEAPTAGSVILAGVLLKMGTYGFLRLAMPMFPEGVQLLGPLFIVLSVIGIIYGALVAMVQPDVKKLVAYSSVSHLGFVMLGLFMLNRQGIQGGILQMINHGLSTGALFLLVGMLYERRHTRLIDDFGGLAKQIPVFATVLMIVTLSSIGLPGTNGFVGEFLILFGAYARAFADVGHIDRFILAMAVLASIGIILAAVYMLWMLQRVIFGRLRHEANRHLKDLTRREITLLLPILALIFLIGIYPKPFLSRTEKTVERYQMIITEKPAGLQSRVTDDLPPPLTGSDVSRDNPGATQERSE